MIIEISKDIERYKESVILGLTLKQFLFSACSLIVGAGLVLLLHNRIGVTLSCYIATPVVAPIALGGFYSYNGMGFYEMVSRLAKTTFRNSPLLCSSTENGKELRQILMEDCAERIATGTDTATGKSEQKKQLFKQKRKTKQ